MQSTQISRIFGTSEIIVQSKRNIIPLENIPTRRILRYASRLERHP